MPRIAADLAVYPAIGPRAIRAREIHGFSNLRRVCDRSCFTAVVMCAGGIARFEFDSPIEFPVLFLLGETEP